MSIKPENSIPFITNLNVRARSDYQKFTFDVNGTMRNIQGRMAQKVKAFSFLPDSFKDKSVLDVGCDFGFWCFMSANRGAKSVLGIDRNRKVRGVGDMDLVGLNTQVVHEWPKVYGQCRFEAHNIGIDWPMLGEFDYVFLCSLYHHIFANCASHSVIAHWLSTVTVTAGHVIWENPLGVDDSVARKHIPNGLHAGYNRKAILGALLAHFEIEFEGPALHEPTRTVLYLRRK